MLSTTCKKVEVKHISHFEQLTTSRHSTFKILLKEN